MTDETQVQTPETPGAQTETQTNDDVDFLDTEVSEKPKEEVKTEETKSEEAPKEAPQEEIVYELPEGYKEEDLDKDALKEFNEMAKKAGLSKEAHAEFFKKHASLVEKYQEQLFERVAKTQREWRSQIENDPEIGGDNKEKTLLSINQMLDTVGGKDEVASFKKEMRDLGAGSNPVIIKFLARVSKMVSEGGYVTGGTPKQTVSGQEKYFSKIFAEMDSYKEAKQKG